MLLTKRELQIMNILWHSEAPLSANEIQEINRDLSINTILAVLRKLLKSEIIATDSVTLSGSTLMRRYKTVLGESEYLSSSASNKALKEIVANFIDDSETDAELDALSAMIERRKEDLKKG